MRTYYDLIKHLKTVFEEDQNVSTVVTEGGNDIDNWKRNVYPLVDINVVNEIETQSKAIARFNVIITVVDIRDINKEEVNDKFWRNDNRHDNWNTTLAILRTARNKMFMNDYLNSGIEVTGMTANERIGFEFANLLDGWQQTWTVEVNDEQTTIC